MNLSPVEQLNSIKVAQKQDSPEALRAAAEQFEAVLLMQLTSLLNTKNDEEGEQLFGGDGGTGLAKQMFSEQLATTMAQSGGVGIAEVIMRQFGITDPKLNGGKLSGLSEAFTAARDSGKVAGLDQTAKPTPLSREIFSGNGEEAEIISTFEDQARSEGIDDSLVNLILDGKIVNTTRSRLAPNSPIISFSDSKSLNVSDINVNVSADIKYQSPVAGRVSSGFGNRFHPIDKVAKFHGGLDLAVPTGTSVEAAAEGVVSFAGWSGGYGNLVIMKHPDGRETRYGHLDKILVSAGNEISAGQPIALSGSTGKSTGPHLHFEIRENGKVVNPNNVLSKGLPRIAER